MIKYFGLYGVLNSYEISRVENIFFYILKNQFLSKGYASVAKNK